ncbi:MAG: RecX family transcriptional regulator [Bacteroides sp.]|nr:RecX family transcriptional regulator [Bacteroides sp.]
MLKKRTISADQARMKLADLCARSEQCESDLLKKLQRWGISMSDSIGIIESLKKGRFLDNSRYAGAFARDKARFSRWGRRKIAMALAAKRIAQADIREGLDSIDEEEYLEALHLAATAKARSLDLTQPTDRQKLYAHLISRGYESPLVSAEIRKQINYL